MPVDWNVRLAHSPRHRGNSRRCTHKSVQRKIKGEEVKSLFNLIIKMNFWWTLITVNKYSMTLSQFGQLKPLENWAINNRPIRCSQFRGRWRPLPFLERTKFCLSFWSAVYDKRTHRISGAVHFICNWELDIPLNIPLDIVWVDYYLSNLSIAQAGALWKKCKGQGSNLNLLPKFCDCRHLHRWLVGLN